MPIKKYSIQNNMPAKTHVLKLLADLGPLTSIEIAEHTGWSRSYARAAVAYCKSLVPRPIYVSTYLRTEEFGRYYPRAVYALGDAEDAPKPAPLTATEYNARYRFNKQTRITDVFLLGVPIDKRRLTTRKRPDVAERLRKAAGSDLGDA